MRLERLRHFILLAGAMFAVLVMTGCEHKTINEIKADPGRYANKEIAITGVVTESASIMGRGGYEIDDGTGKLWIISSRGVPREGARVTVKGTIRDGYNLSSLVNLPEQVSSGLVMIEDSHKAR
ncbi:MAG: hypothetical protein GXX84_07470 [Acidobacteria bacterium]|nr:hypothetical protein [Acidobacteriota bacterium]